MGLIEKFEKFWSDMLFNNVGKKCKAIATKIAINIIMPYIVVGVMVALLGVIDAIDREDALRGWISVLIAYIVITVGWHKAELQTIMLYAKGELVEKVTEIDNKLDELKKSNEKEEAKSTEGTENAMPEVPPVTIPVEPPVITDEATLEEYKKKIDEFLLDAGKCVRISELRECWESLNLGRHPVVENIGKEILEAEKVERFYGFLDGRAAKTVEKITSYYLMAKFRKEI